MAAGIVLLSAAFFSAAQAAPGCTYGACAPSAQVVSRETTKYSATVTSDLISDRINAAFDLSSPAGSGLSGGDGPTRGHVWGNASNNWLSRDTAGADYSGTLTTGVGGADLQLTPDFMAGVAIGYEHLDLTTDFNQGKLKTNGVTFGSYGAYALSRVLTLVGQAGYTLLDYDERRPGVSGSFDARRWFAAADLQAHTVIDRWVLRTSLGYFHVNEDQDAYSESNGASFGASSLYVGQLRVKGEVGYRFETSWGSVTPLVSARPEYNLIQSSERTLTSSGELLPERRLGATLGLGADAEIGNDWTMMLRGTYRVSTFSDEHNYGIVAGIKKRF